MSVKGSSQILNDIVTYLADNTSEDISAQDLRTELIDIVDSFLNTTDFFTGATNQYVSGNGTLQNISSWISDTAYNATSWNGVTTISPSKNAVRDEIENIYDYIDTEISLIDFSSLWGISGNTLSSRGILGSTSGNFGFDIKKNNVTQGGLSNDASWFFGTTAKFTDTFFSIRSTGDDDTTYNSRFQNSDGTDLFSIRDDGRLLIPYAFKLGIYGSNSETGGGLAYIIGNSVIADTSTDNQLIKTSGDNGIWMRMIYNGGISFHTGLSGSSGTTSADDANMRMLIDNAGNATFYMDSFWSSGAGPVVVDTVTLTPYRLTVASGVITAVAV